MVEMDSDQKSTISGKEKLMDGVDGLEISISGHFCLDPERISRLVWMPYHQLKTNC